MSMADLLKKGLEAQQAKVSEGPASPMAQVLAASELDVPQDYRALREAKEQGARRGIQPALRTEQKSIEGNKYEFPNVEFISRETWEAHVKLYDNYVVKYNEVVSMLKTVPKDKSNAAFSIYAELRRRYSFLWNAVCLHDLYFQNVGPSDMTPPEDTIAKSFGSFAAWKEDFTACAMGTHGWAIMGLDSDDDLVNFTMDDHHVGCIVNVKPILVLDVMEHSYWLDYPGDKKAYVGAFMREINWGEVDNRLEGISK